MKSKPLNILDIKHSCMPYIRDPDFARLTESLEAIRDTSEDANAKYHAKRALTVLKEYKGR